MQITSVRYRELVVREEVQIRSRNLGAVSFSCLLRVKGAVLNALTSGVPR
jgi:hypothetical protein